MLVESNTLNQEDVFRGVFPAASLKRINEQSGNRRHARVFRGVFPAASLKLRVDMPHDTSDDVFRGVFPAASLKQEYLAGTKTGDQVVFRGVFPAASLKRVKAGSASQARGLFSAGYSPRPH